MTVRLHQLKIEPRDDIYLVAPEDGTNVLLTDEHDVNLLSIVRHIMRDRSDCTQIPVVLAAVVHPTNSYGHNMQVEVRYSKNGWRAIYGAHVAERVTNVQCYCD